MSDIYHFKEIPLTLFQGFENNEFSTYYQLHAIHKSKNLYPDINTFGAKKYYENEILGLDSPLFYETQLKSFLIRYSESFEVGISSAENIIRSWALSLSNSIDNPCYKEFLDEINKLVDLKYIKYLYPFQEIDNYYEKWISKDVTLNDWKKFPFIEIYKDLITNDYFSTETIDINETHHDHFKRLSKEYSEEIFDKIFAPRLKNQLILQKEKKYYVELLMVQEVK